MHIPRYWRAQSQRYSLTGEICKQCGARLFPPRDICPECRELALEVHEEGLPQTVGLIKLRV
jgi:uncharacterized OB-fold protein